LRFVRKKIEEINEIVNNQQILFKRDEEKQAPMIQRWGIPIESMIDEREKALLSGDAPNLMEWSFQKPKVGYDMSEQLIQKCSEMLGRFDSLTA
jgi:hypothetical protein